MWVKNAEFRPSKISLYKFTKENYKRKKCGPKILILTSKIFFYKFTKENYKRKKCGPKIPNSELQNFFL